MVVHDVEVNESGPRRFNRLDLFAKSGEVGGENAWGNAVGLSVRRRCGNAGHKNLLPVFLIGFKTLFSPEIGLRLLLLAAHGPIDNDQHQCKGYARFQINEPHRPKFFPLPVPRGVAPRLTPMP